MLDQNTFMETLRAVEEIIRTSAEPLTREEILSYFKDMELDGQQEEMIFTYLSTPQEEETPAEAQETLDAAEDQEEAESKTEEGDPFSQSPVFRMYVEELKEISAYSEEQMIDMYKKLLAGEESMVHTLAKAWLPNVLTVAKKLALSPEGFEDVVQEGNMALFLRLDELCGSGEKTDVEEELLTAVEEAMKACIREQTGEDEQENAVVGKVALISEAVHYLKDKRGHEPSLEEISDYAKIPREELAEIINMMQKAKQEH